MDDPLLTVPEAGARLGASRMTVYRFINAGELAVVDIRTPGASKSRLRIRASALQAFIDARTHDPIDPTTALDEVPSNKSA